jgi:hypothetical protein
MAGGGTTGSETGDGYTQGKPYDLYGQPNALMVQQIDEMFTTLFKALTRAGVDLDTINEIVDNVGTGDVVGPSSAVADDIAVFNSTTGKLIKDGGYTIAQILTTAGNLTVASHELTAAEIRSLNTTPVNIVPGVAGRIYVPLSWTLEKTVSSGFSANPNFGLRWTGDTNELMNSPALSMNSTGTTFTKGVPANVTNIATTVMKGKGLEIKSTADVTGGTGTLNVQVSYLVYVALY